MQNGERDTERLICFFCRPSTGRGGTAATPRVADEDGWGRVEGRRRDQGQTEEENVARYEEVGSFNGKGVERQ